MMYRYAKVAHGREEPFPAAGADRGPVAGIAPYQMRATGKAQRRDPMPTSDADRGIRA
jgi:hypothetical protein